ncbi:MAG: methyl-accepting chemotaxis protein [Myxococcota bacterium]
MEFMNNLTLRWKLLITLGSVMLLFSSQQLVFSHTEDTLKMTDHAHEALSERLDKLSRIEVSAQNMARAGIRAIFTGLEKDIQSYQEAQETTLKLLSAPLPTFEGSEDHTQELSALRSAVERWHSEVVSPTLKMRADVDQGKVSLMDVQKFYISVSQVPLGTRITESIDRIMEAEHASGTKLDARSQKDRENMAQLNILIFVGCSGLGLLMAYLVSNSLSGRVLSTLDVLEGMAQGDFSQSVTVDGSDELGRMRGSIQEVSTSVGTKVQQLRQAMQAAAGGDFTREVEVSGNDPLNQMGDSLNQLLKSLRESLGQVSVETERLATSSGQVRSVSSGIQQAAEESSAQSNAVAQSSEEVSRNVQAVAAAAEEMSASIREIAKNAADAARVATEAVKVASHANATISRLGDSSTQIGNVVKVITTIAQQTNLLALNATIEAARAGEAGKGFAVVANEVKALAQETAKATEDISRRVETIQADTKAAVNSIGEISHVIHQVNDISSTIASAVEEQTATTNEISRSVSEAAKGSAEITQSIVAVVDASRKTSDGIREVVEASERFLGMAQQLEAVVSQFELEEKRGGRRPKSTRVTGAGARGQAMEAFH